MRKNDSLKIPVQGSRQNRVISCGRNVISRLYGKQGRPGVKKGVTNISGSERDWQRSSTLYHSVKGERRGPCEVSNIHERRRGKLVRQ